MAFDRAQRRFVLCNAAACTYRVYDFEHLLGWHGMEQPVAYGTLSRG